MKKKTLIIVGILLFILMCICIGFLILGYGYGGGRAVRPVEPNQFVINLEEEIKKEVKSSGTVIDTPRNYELDNCDKYGFLQQDVSIYIDNDSLKNELALKTYIINVNKRLQNIFPYKKKCYDSVVIQTQYFDKKIDSTINNRFSFPMIK